ncbi:MAG: response regulator transcription factor [Deltaproteobacteria bacterium]|jgi:two-component system response regulator CpxR|nr:response regulator transcription factor [Deltaproteobacteria bacterium]
MATILIIDDDAELFSLLGAYFKAEGFTAVHAADAEKGLREAAKGGHDALILDVMLPGMNGFEVLRRLRAEETTALIPVLMLTARGEEIDRVIGLEMGADDYLAKPFSSRELVARLRALLRRTSSSKANLPLQHVDDLCINRASLCININGRQQDLTVSELRLLTFLTQNIGEIASRDTLYKSIFGHPAYPMDRSLDMLVSRLRKKLGPRKDGRERIRAVRGEGYIYLLAGETI